MKKTFVPKIAVKLQYFLLGLNIELVISRTILKLQKWFYTFFNTEFCGLLKMPTLFPYFNPIPHGMCRAHNFTGGGHIDPTTLEALGEPKYVP